MPNVVYRFSSSGANDVERAFRAIAESANAAKRASQAAGKVGGQSRTSGQSGATSEAKQASKKYDAIERQRAKDASRELKSGERNASRIATAQRKIHEKELRKQAQYNERLHASAQKRQLDAIKRQKRAEEKIWADRGSRIGGMGTAVAGIGLGIASAIGGAIAASGGAALRQTQDLQTMASKVAVQGRGPGEAVADSHEIRKGWERAATRTPGAKASEIGSAVSQFVTRTGRLDVAQQWQEQMAEIMVATDVAGADLGNTMATLFQKFGISGTADMEQAFADLAFQGKKGAFELSDMAAYMAEIGAATERYGGLKGAEGVRKVGGLMQIAKGSVGSGAEASTALQAMFRQLIAKSGSIKKGTGFDVWQEGKVGTVTKDVNDVLVGTISGFKGNLVKLQEVFDKRGVMAVSPLIAAFNEASKGGQDVAAGERAMRDMLRDAATTGASYADVQQDAALRSAGAGASMTTAWESFASVMGGALEPAAESLSRSLMKLATSDSFGIIISELGEAIASFVESLAGGIDAITSKLVDMGFIKQADVDARKNAREGERARKLVGGLPEDRQAALRTLVAGYSGEVGMTADIMGRIGEAEGFDPRVAKAAYELRTQEVAASGYTGSQARAEAAPPGTGWQDVFDAIQVATMLIPGAGAASMIAPSSNVSMGDKDMAKVGRGIDDATGAALAQLQMQAAEAAGALAELKRSGALQASTFSP